MFVVIRTALVALLALLAGCSASLQRDSTQHDLVLSRADTMAGLLTAWADGYRRQHPQANVVLRQDAKLSAEAFDALLDGSADIAPFVREPFASETERFTARYGYPPTLIAVATGSYATRSSTHALAIYVNAQNPLRKISLPELSAIYSDRYSRWSQLGVVGDWAQRPIHAYSMLRRRSSGNPPGIVNFFSQRVLGGGQFAATVREVDDATGIAALDGIVSAVRGDPDGIGFSGFANWQPGTRRLAIAERESGPFMEGSLAEVTMRKYPLTRTIYLCINRAPNQALAPTLRAFLQYVLEPDGQAAITQDASNFLPLPPREIRAQLRRLE